MTRFHAVARALGAGALLLWGCGDSDAGDGASGDASMGNPSAPRPGRCGDGVLDPDEDCDGRVVAQSCQSLGMLPGTLSCLDDCTLDTRLCGTGQVSRPDGSVQAPVDELGLACDRIRSCGTVPLSGSLGGLPPGFSPIVLVQPFTCETVIGRACADCQLAARRRAELDAGAGDPCDDDCLGECWSLTRERGDDFQGPGCSTTLPAYMPATDARCTCDACPGQLFECFQQESCYQAMLCIDATGCRGDDCLRPEVCGVPPLSLEPTSFSPELVGGLANCMANAGC